MKMKLRIKALVAATFFGLVPHSVQASLVTVDFEQAVPRGDGPPLIQDGFVFDALFSPDRLTISDGTDVSMGYNGTQFLTISYRNNSHLEIYREGGGVFGIRQLDMTEGDVFGSGSTCDVVLGREGCTVTFVGQLTDGETISRTIALDGIHDKTGPLVDFETFEFDAGWNRLTMFSVVSAQTYLHPGLDNLVFRTVPEPDTLALVGLGLSALMLARRHRRSTSD
jgi:hypothetical protein